MLQHDKFDNFFRILVSDPGRAFTILKLLLPDYISRNIAEGALPADAEGTIVSKFTGKKQCDALFRMRMTSGLEFLALVEHKSWPDPVTPNQLNYYRLAIAETSRFKVPGNPKRCQPIVSLVLYHGDAPWNIDRSCHPILVPENDGHDARMEFSDEYHLTELVQMPLADLVSDKHVLSGLMMMSLSGKPDSDKLDDPLRVIAAGFAQEGFGLDLARYVYQITNTSEERMLKIEAEIRPDEKDRVMQTVAEKIRAEERREGLKEGRKEGRKEGSQRILLNLLVLKFGTVPENRRQQVVAADEQELDTWIARMLTADNFDEVFSTAN